MVSGPTGQPPIPGQFPPVPGSGSSQIPPAPPVQPVQPTTPPPDPSSQQGSSTQSEQVALNRSNGTDRVEISQNAINASSGDLSAPNRPGLNATTNSLNGAPNAPSFDGVRPGPQGVNRSAPNVDTTPQAFNQPRQTFPGAPEVGQTVDLFG